MSATGHSIKGVVEINAEQPAQPTPHQLIDSCQGLVRALAWKIHQKLRSAPHHVELDDLIAYGTLGLTQAAKEYDQSRGCRFITYAHHRIRGAIFDGLSQMSWFSRYDYHSSRYEHMGNELLARLSEDGSDSSAATVADEVRWLRDASGSLLVVYLASGEDERGQTPIFDDNEPEPSDHSIGGELKRKLHELIDELPIEAGSLIRATYFEGLTLQAAGERLGISKAWASRLHSKTLLRLAQSLRLAGVAD